MIVMIGQSLLAQTEQREKKSFFSFYFNRSKFDNFSSNVFGLNFEFFLSENFSLNYSFGLGTSLGSTHIHLPAGIIGGIYMIADETERESLNFDEEDNSSGFTYGSSIFLMFLPEGINYYFPLSQYLKLGIYINPFGYDFYTFGETISSSIGFKAVYNINDKFLLIPHFGYNLFWNESGVPNLGLSFGIKY